MRVSSPITPSFSGTLKSTRINTRAPFSSRSRIDSFIRSPSALQAFLHQQPQQIYAAARVAPLVVVPRQHFHEVAVHDLGVGRIDDRRVRVALEVDRDQ